MLLTLYKGLTRTATPLLEVYLKRRLKRGKEDPVRFSERFGKALTGAGEQAAGLAPCRQRGRSAIPARADTKTAG